MRGQVAQTEGRRSRRCEPGVDLVALDRSMLNLDLRAAAIPAAEVENYCGVVRAPGSELAAEQEREPALMRRQEELPPLPDEATEIREAEDVDVVHGLQRIVQQDKRHACLPGRPAEREEVGKGSDVRLRRIGFPELPVSGSVTTAVIVPRLR